MGLQALALYYQTDEAKEGTAAFLEKRKPDFRSKLAK
jgi:2-ketocyclohexanecarboxyl-CoA hydrolase